MYCQVGEHRFQDCCSRVMPTVGLTVASLLGIALGLTSVIVSAGTLRPPRVDESFGKLPLMFERLADGDDRFICRGAGYSVSVSPSETLIVMRSDAAVETSNAHRGRGGQGTPWSAGNETRVGITLKGSRTDSVATGLQQMPATMNYFTGN